MLLTYNGENDNHKIKYIPTNGEIITTECNQFQDKFPSEKDDENDINPVQNIFHGFVLVICFNHHGHHIETDKNHDANIKCLLGNTIKN